MKRFTILLLALLLGLLALPVFAQDGNEAANMASIQWVADEALTGGNPDALDELFASDYVAHVAPSFSPDPVGINGYKFLITSVHNAMPDFTATVDVVIAEGDWTAHRLTWRGTFENPLLLPDGTEVPPTGQPIELSFNTISRFNEEGKIVEEWISWDNLSWLTQIGLIEMPAAEETEAADEPAQTTMESDFTVQETSEEAEADLRAGIQELTEQAFNQGNLAILDERVSEDFLAHPENGDREAFRQDVAAIRAAVPDAVSTADMIVVDGNWAAFRFTLRGTFQNEFVTPHGTIPPTGQPLEVSFNIIGRFDEQGRLVEDWEEVDNLAFLTQLGVIPMPEAG